MRYAPFALCTLVWLAPSVLAAQLVEMRQTIFGMDWSVCAHAVRVAVQKLNGVERVEVSLEQGAAVIRFRADTRATVAQVRRAIRNNGFTPREAQVRLRGRILEQAGRLFIAVPGQPGVFPLAAGPGAMSAERLRQAVGARVALLGSVAERVATETTPPVAVMTLTVSGGTE